MIELVTDAVWLELERLQRERGDVPMCPSRLRQAREQAEGKEAAENEPDKL